MFGRPKDKGALVQIFSDFSARRFDGFHSFDIGASLEVSIKIR